MAFQKRGDNKKKKQYGWQDEVWQRTVGDLDTAWGDYKSERQKQLERIRGVDVKPGKKTKFVGGDYLTALADMNLQGRRDKRAMTADYGSRGMLMSGGYAKDYTDYNMDLAKQREALKLARDRGIEDIWGASGAQKKIYEQQRQNARLEAIRRRAIELSLRP